MLLSPHFTLEELACTDRKAFKDINIQEALKIPGKMYMLAGFAERIREIIGRPVIINSGFRCQALNAAVGGVMSSQHVLAEALDIRVNGKTAEELFRIVVASDLKYDQLIWEKPGKNAAWLHISIGSKKEKLKYDGKKYTRFG